MASLLFRTLALFLLTVLLPSGPSAASRTRALETIEVPPPEGKEGLGIRRYQAILFSAADYGEKSGIPDLETPNRDIQEIGRVLKENFGFATDIVENATEADIISRLDQLKTQTEEDDAVLVYFAGHGMYDEAEGRGYWLPADADIAQTSRWVSNDDVGAKLRAIPARHVLMIVDSCFSGMFRDVPRPTGAVASLAPLQKLSSKRSRVVLSSGGNEPVSDAGRDGISVFAYFLRQGLLEAPGRYLVTDTLFPELRARVQQNAEQTPQQGVFQRAFHEGGQLVLVNQKAPEGTVAARAVSREDAEKACRRQGFADPRSPEAYAALSQATASETLEAVDKVAADKKMRERLAFYACVDKQLGLLTDDDHAALTGLLAGDAGARERLTKAALAEERRKSRELPPPDACDVSGVEASSLLLRSHKLLRDGAAQSDRAEDREARKLLEAGVRKHPSAPLWAALARARLYTDGDPEQVTEAADAAAEACPSWGVPDSYRAGALVMAANTAGARAAAERAVARSPEYAFGYYNLATIQLGTGETAPAMAALDRALQLDPLLGEAHYLRGRVQHASGEVGKAVASLESAADLRPRNAMVWQALAAAYEAAGNAGAAKVARQRASKL